jgi:para-nitrobenzyl esterase
VDGDIITGDEYTLYQMQRFNDTPVLAGFNADEGQAFVRRGEPAELFAAQIRSRYGTAAESILAAYPHATDVEALQAERDLVRDAFHGWDAWAWVGLQSRYGRNKAFLYYFDYHSPGSRVGPTHAAEIRFVFGTLHAPGSLALQEAPQRSGSELSDLIGRYWINFAATGDPNGNGLPKWPAFGMSTQLAMFLDEQPKARPLPDRKQLRVFDEYHSSLRGKNSGGAAFLAHFGQAKCVRTPHGCSTGNSSSTSSMGMANPIPCVPRSTIVLTPITAPESSSSGPPLLPGLMGASVCRRRCAP